MSRSPPSKMSFHHVPVGEPTLLDTLPGDVLRYCIMPFLGWEDRIHINRMTPPGDRTPPNKIPKDRIVAHQLNIVVPHLMKKVRKANDLYARRARRVGVRPPIYEVADAVIEVFREIVKNHNMLAVQHSPRLRETVLQKVAEFSEPANVRAIPRIAQRAEMQDALHHVLLALEKYPAKNEVKPWKWGKARVTQVEVAMLHQEWTERGQFIRRYGDIYSDWE